MTLPTSGFYSDVMQSYLGYLSPDEQQVVWGDFLQKNGLPANPSPTDVTEQASFVSFIQSYFDQNQVEILSPEEIQKRRIMFETFTTVLHMLTILQNTIAVQTNNVAFYTKYQGEYTNMLAKIPILVAEPNSQIVVSSDPTKFTFGYNNISVRDLAEYAAYSGETTGIDNSFSIPGLSYIAKLLIFPSTPTTQGELYFYWNYTDTVTGTLSSNFTVPLPPYDPDPAVNAKNIEDTFISFVTNNSPGLIGVPGTVYGTIADFLQSTIGQAAFSIPWQYTQPYPTTTTDSDQQDVNSNVAKLRAEINSKNQSLISSITAYRTTIRDRSQVVQDNLSQTREAYSQQANLIRSITESLRGLLSAIFK